MSGSDLSRGAVVGGYVSAASGIIVSAGVFNKLPLLGLGALAGFGAARANGTARPRRLSAEVLPRRNQSDQHDTMRRYFNLETILIITQVLLSPQIANRLIAGE